jgi:hypothetical protein
MIVGYKEVHAALSALPKAINDKVWSDINFDRAKIIVNRMQLTAPEGPTGNLVDSIGAVRLKKQNLGTVWVGPRRRGGKKGFAGHLVEYGTKKRRTRNGANRGVMPKNPFASRAWDQTKGQLEPALAKSAQKVLTRTIKKYV